MGEPEEPAESSRVLRSDVAPRPAERLDHDLDPRQRCAALLRSGGDCAELDPEDIAHLLCDKRAAEQLFAGVTTLQLRGVRGQALDLSGQTLQVKLELLDCELAGLDLTDARFIGVSMRNCAIGEIKAQRISCSGSLLIQSERSDRTQGPVQLDGAVIGGNLEIGTLLLAPADARLYVAGISADGIKVAGHAFFCGTVCRGNLWLAGASVGRDLDLRATTVTSGGARSTLSLHSSRVGGRLLLGPGAQHGNTHIDATSNWRNLRVESGIVARNARFDGKLKLDSASIVGSLYFSGSHFGHKVQGQNMRVEGDVSFDGAVLELKSPLTDAPLHKAAGLDLSGCRVTGCGFFGEHEGRAFRANAPLRLRASQFNERLVFMDLQLSTGKLPAVSMVGCSVGAELQLAPAQPEQLEYDLRDVRCRSLQLRGRPARARLNGLKYSVLDVVRSKAETTADAAHSAQAMLEMIQQFHGQPAQFVPGPFKELEAYLHATGLEGLARDVARARRRSELASERAAARTLLARMRAAARSCVLWCAGYGYSATTALGVSMLVLGLFIGTALLAPELTGQFCQSGHTSCEPSFLALLRLALDNFVPIVKLGLAEELSANGTAAHWMLACLRMSGWLLTTLMVVAWSGLMRKQ